MVSTAQLAAMIAVIIGSMIIIALPFILYRQNLTGVLKIYFAGAMIFFIGDSLLRFSAINLINFNQPMLTLMARALVSVAIAILFRVFVLKGVLDKQRQSDPVNTGVILGLGQAGMEAVIVAFRFIGHFQISRAINDGSIHDLVSENVTAAQIDEAIAVLTQSSILDIVGSLIILAFYIIIHIGFALMIIEALKTNDRKMFMLISVIYLALVLSEMILVSNEMSMILRILMVGAFVLIHGYYIRTRLKERRNVRV